MSRLIILCSALFISSVYANDCETNLECGKCDKRSEFAWNPDDAFVTNELSYFYQLPEIIESHYQNGNFNEVVKYSNDYLKLASTYQCNWNYGNAIHDANRYLGLISLKRNNLEKAAMHLVLSSQTSGSMQLEAFGPDLDLANNLLKEGKREQVVQYLENMDTIWDNDKQIYKWISKIEAGQKPLLHRSTDAQLELRRTARSIF